jgi:hypothetical protein
MSTATTRGTSEQPWVLLCLRKPRPPNVDERRDKRTLPGKSVNAIMGRAIRLDYGQ